MQVCCINNSCCMWNFYDDFYELIDYGDLSALCLNHIVKSHDGA